MNSVPPPKYAPNIALTVKYLYACNQLFERGILSHTRIWLGESVIVQNMEKNCKLFTLWLDGLLQDGMFFPTACTKIWPIALKCNMSCQYLVPMMVCFVGYDVVDSYKASNF